MKKRIFAMLMAAAMMLSMAACGNGTEEKKTENSAGTEAQAAGGESTLVYGSNDYTRINPAMDEHGEIKTLKLTHFSTLSQKFAFCLLSNILPFRNDHRKLTAASRFAFHFDFIII